MKIYDEMRQALKDLRIDILKEKIELLIDDTEEIDELKREINEANDRIEELESELEDEKTKFGINECAEDQWKDDLWPQIKNKFSLTQLENLLK